MSKNIRKSVIFAVILMGLFITTSTIARAEDVVPVSAGANADASVVFVPSSQGSNDAGDSTIVPSSSGSNDNEGGSVIIPSSDGSNTDEPTTPSTPPSNGGGSSGGSSGSSGSGSNSSSLAVASTTKLTSSSISTSINPLIGGACTYLNDYLKIDRANNPAEVTKLQIFLKNTEKIDVDATGIFDTKTFEGVKAFQAKYLTEVMGPWGVTTPTGQVWYTTKKKINEIYCKAPFALTAEQLAQINAYKNGIAQGTIVVDANGAVISPIGTSTSPEVGSNDNGSQAASAGISGVATKIWNFIKWLFGY